MVWKVHVEGSLWHSSSSLTPKLACLHTASPTGFHLFLWTNLLRFLVPTFPLLPSKSYMIRLPFSVYPVLADTIQWPLLSFMHSSPALAPDRKHLPSIPLGVRGLTSKPGIRGKRVDLCCGEASEPLQRYPALTSPGSGYPLTRKRKASEGHSISGGTG